MFQCFFVWQLRVTILDEGISLNSAQNFLVVLSSELGARQAQREVVKIKIFDFAYWA